MAIPRNAINGLMREKGIKQVKLCHLLEVHVCVLNKWIRGVRTMPKGKRIILSWALGISLDDITKMLLDAQIDRLRRVMNPINPMINDKVNLQELIRRRYGK